MLKNHLIVAVRNLSRQRAFSVINVLGLSTGLTAFILIMLYVRFEFSYDDFHERAGDTYRIATRVMLEGETINRESTTYTGILRVLREQYAEAQAVTVVSGFDSDGTFLRAHDKDNAVTTLGNFRGCYADPMFFEVFSFPLIEGERSKVLKQSHSAVISKALAEKYFDNNPVGKILEFTDDNTDAKLLTITGVMENVPVNSHLKFDIVINMPEAPRNFWDWTGHCYVILNPGADPGTVASTLDAIALTNNGLKTNADDYGQISTFALQPLADIHLFSRLESEFEPGGNGMLVYSLTILAIIVLIIAWVNYINLSTAMATQKIRQIGIRKVIGATKRQLALQTFAESSLYNLVSFITALCLTWWLLPAFSTLMGIPPQAIEFGDPDLWLLFAGFFVISTFVSGAYPALVITSYYPLSAMKARGEKTDASTLRKGLVSLQFAAATMLMVLALVSYKQLTFMQHQDLGINVDQVLVIKALNFDKERWSDVHGGYVVDSSWQQRAEQFHHELREQSNILNTTSVSHIPGQMPVWGTEFKAKAINSDKAYSLKAVGIDYDFISTFQARLLAGRNFSRDFPSDRGNENRRAVLINEAASKLLGFATPQFAISKHLTTYWGADYEIIGVLNSFHQLSVKEDLTPMYFILQPRALSYYAVSFHARDATALVSNVRDIWKRHFPEIPFDFIFLDEYFDSQYKTEVRFSTAMGAMTVLALAIGCMGLFGLTSYAIVRRTKEVGIRKVLGASIANVVVLFTTDLLRSCVVAGLVAVPFVYYAIDQWLSSYANRISLEWWMFGVPVGAIAGVFFVTVALQTVGLARRNPVESLKGE